VSYINRDWMLPRRIMISGSGFGLIALSLWRFLWGQVVLHGIGAQRVLFLGRNPVIEQISEYIHERPEIGFVNLGYLDDGSEPGAIHNNAKVLGGVRDLVEIANALKPDRIVVGMSERRDRMPVQQLLDLRFSGILIEEAAMAYETACGRICTKELRPSQLIFSGELGPRHSSVVLQSIYSPAIALFGFAVGLPVMLLAAVFIKLTSRGPVLFRQSRVGVKGKTFILYKFRSMYVDAEAKTGAIWATRDDPRVTPVGRWLRRLRIDELPQFWNVLRGDMAIVGPRPERPEFVRVLAEKIPYYRQRHCIKPGITGWAQINYKYGETVEDTIAKTSFFTR
jgi:exopolysaccharide biosynthesis polyprenyl glycosylphosphotransferase